MPSNQERLALFGEGFTQSDDPPSSPQVQTDIEIRCWRCNRMLAEKASRPWVIKCSRCKSRNEGKIAHHRARVTGSVVE